MLALAMRFPHSPKQCKVPNATRKMQRFDPTPCMQRDARPTTVTHKRGDWVRGMEKVLVNKSSDQVSRDSEKEEGYSMLERVDLCTFCTVP